MNKLLYEIGIAFVLSLTATAVDAQEKYPTKPIRLLVPFAPGGGADILARLIGPPVSESLGRAVVVDNRVGGGGTVGAGIVVRSDPDGYTLILVTASYGANAALYDLPYDSVTDITPIILIGTTCLVATTHPAVPIKSVKELIAHAKTNPGKLNFGSGGAGDLAHLASELFKLRTGAVFTFVPYKGSGPVMNALLGGEVDLSFSSLVASMPHVKAGRLRAIGVTTLNRSRALPEVPTVGETVHGYEVVHWYGMWGPKGLPKDIVTRWNREVAKVLQADAMKKWLEREGVEPAGGLPDEFLNRIKSDVEKWKRVVKNTNIIINR